jgi:hypothetical protein
LEELNKLKYQIIKWTFVTFAVLAVLSIVFLQDKKGMVLGLVFGTAISCLNFLELGKTLEKAVKMNPGKAQAYTTSRYFLRYLISAIVIFISIKADYINVLGTVVGFLSIKFVIFVTNLFNDKRYFKKIFDRKEEDE